MYGDFTTGFVTDLRLVTLALGQQIRPALCPKNFYRLFRDLAIHLDC